MIIEDEYIQLANKGNFTDVLLLAEKYGYHGRGILELNEPPYIEFDESMDNGKILMDINQYLLFVTNGDEVTSFILDPHEFEHRLTPPVVLEFERMLNILMPTLSNTADVYQVISDIMGVEAFSLIGDITARDQHANIDGYICNLSLNLDKNNPNNYSVKIQNIN